MVRRLPSVRTDAQMRSSQRKTPTHLAAVKRSKLSSSFFMDQEEESISSKMVSGSVSALFAGFFGAAGALFAKLTLGADHLRELCESRISEPDACAWLHVPLRLLCAALLFTFNTIMWTFFSKALRHCSSSARATVTTTASNFISSAVLGRLIFGETHTALWWVGMSLTLCGLLVLHGSTPQAPPQDEAKKDT